MAILATAQWWIRTDGNDLNGGGYDSAISGAGTNYCDQASAQLSLTDCATADAFTTTLTSATGGFTAAMIGNSIRLSSGTNVTEGDYFITGYTDTNTVTLDRVPAGFFGGLSGVVGRVGGAWASPEFTCTTASTPCPSPLMPLHTIHLRGSGSANPSSVDYTFATYRTFTSGGYATGMIRMIGYNGTPHIRATSRNLIAYNTTYWHIESCKFSSGGGTQTNYPMFSPAYGSAYRCIYDQMGEGGYCAQGNVTECLFQNTGGTAGDNYPMWMGGAYGHPCVDSVFVGSAGSKGAIQLNSMATATGNLIVSPAIGIYISESSAQYHPSANHNTIVGATTAGIQIITDEHWMDAVQSNLMASCAKGIYATVTIPQQALAGGFNNNAFYNCTANYDGITAGPDDVLLTADPFTDSSSADYSLNDTASGGADIRSRNVLGNPGYTTTASHRDAGASQHQGGGGSTIIVIEE